MSRSTTRWARLTAPAAGGLVLAAVLAGGLVYAATGGPARDDLTSQMLINAIVVVGIQVFVGNTGVLSFGHVGFGGIAGFTFALFAIEPARKATIIPNAPFGIGGVHLSPMVAVLVAVAVALAVAVVVAYALVRSGARSGAVSATVITLALLFLVHEVAVNWTDLTGGDRAGLSFPIGGALDSKAPIVVALVLAVVVARLFAAAPVGRLTRAAREDDLAARAMGINPAVHQVAALLLSVAIVAVGSALRVWELGTVTPRFFFFDYALLTLTMLIVGGRNSLTGALAGVALITAGQELTRYLAGPSVSIGALDWILRDGLTSLFLGGSMLGFMILRPDGLLRDWELDEWFTRRRARGEVPPPAAPPLTAGAPVELAVDGVAVTFGGFRALDHATVHATSDTVVGVIGPNGAGKTTLLNVITGLVPAATGRVALDGVDLTGLAPHAISRAGLVRTFQNLRLFRALTVRENVAVAAIVASRHRADRARPDVDELLVLCGLWDLRNRRAGELDYGNSRRLELARAAAAAPTFLLLDEPTSGMSDTESAAMVEHVRATAAAAAAGVVVIDHDLAFITGICDRVVCFDQGAPIAAGTPGEIQADPLVQAAYLGAVAAR